MEQLAARWAHNPKVTGSSPVPATSQSPLLIKGGFIFLKIFSFLILFEMMFLK
jgi:hypothetical protein